VARLLAKLLGLRTSGAQHCIVPERRCVEKIHIVGWPLASGRRGIFVEPTPKIKSSPVEAAYLVHFSDDVAPDGALFVLNFPTTRMSAPRAFKS